MFQQQLKRLEDAGIVASRRIGRTRSYTVNPRYPQSLEQALLVAATQRVKFAEVRRWSAREGFNEAYRTFEKRRKG